MNGGKRTAIRFAGLGLAALLLFVADVLAGDSALSPGEVWGVFAGRETDETVRNIVLSIRLVRVVVAVLIRFQIGRAHV